ncbi:MAG TPA: IucA/IucC family siderophore biosynthesis protein, partial [Microbacterium sp.]|nr:IucA/IucC family siderophore biosynthesis protein [Microbacterium sp.]
MIAATASSPATSSPAASPRPTAPAHLTPAFMDIAQRHLVAKAIAEFTHERLLAPTPDGDGWRLELDDGRIGYRFRAERTSLEHWIIDEPSIERTVDGVPAPLDAQRLIIELQPLLEIPEPLLATYLEEVASTLASAAFKAHRGGLSAAEVA